MLLEILSLTRHVAIGLDPDQTWIIATSDLKSKSIDTWTVVCYPYARCANRLAPDRTLKVSASDLRYKLFASQAQISPGAAGATWPRAQGRNCHASF